MIFACNIRLIAILKKANKKPRKLGFDLVDL